MENKKLTCSHCGKEFESCRAVHIKARQTVEKINTATMCIRCAAKFIEKHGQQYQVVKSTNVDFSTA